MVIAVNMDAVEDVKLKTYVFLILDRSGSMSSVRNETISHFNEQIQTIKAGQKDNMENYVSLITFGSDVTNVFHKTAALGVKELSADDYRPDGGTAMYDAVGDALELASKIPDINDENVSVLVIILSDGHENSSKRFSSETIAEKIQTLQNTKRWTFTYIGANQDLAVISKKFNIPLNNMLRFKADSIGVRGMSANTSASIGTYFAGRSRGVSQVVDFYSPADPITDPLIDINTPKP